MEIVALFCDIDDFCLQLGPLWQHHLVSDGNRQRWREQRLCLSEVMTIVVSFHQSGYRTLVVLQIWVSCLYGHSKLVAVDEQTNHDIVQLGGFRKADRLAH